MVVMEDEDLECSPDSLGHLLCKENAQALFTDQEEDDSNSNSSSLLGLSNLFVSDNEDEYIETLIQRENNNNNSNVDGSSFSPTNNNHWLKSARFEAIDWILKMRTLFGFCFQTAYLSVTYFDHFLSKRSVDSEKIWAIRLLSVACLTLAAKMEECSSIPKLSEFKIDEYNFDNEVIQRMELLVLNTLQWRMSSITPFPYLHFFITKLVGESRLKDLLPKTVNHVFSILKEINLMDQRPSSIAVAAVLVASNKELTRKMVELELCSIPTYGSLNNDQVFTCYNLMLGKEKEKTKIPKFLKTPELSSINFNPTTNLVEESFFNPASRSKRRRLTFNGSDQNNEKEFQ